MAVAISAAVGAKNSTGTEAPNKPADVTAIQRLLLAVRAEPEVVANGKCDDRMIEAIRAFQVLFGGTPDGRIDPGGRRGSTLYHLNRIASPLALKPIARIGIEQGAFQIRLDGEPLPDYWQLWLAFANNPAAKMHVEPVGNSRDLITRDNLPTLMFLVDKAKAWGKTAMLRLFVTRGMHTVSESAGAAMACPVKPYCGTLQPDRIGAEPGLVYSGVLDGRFFHFPAIGGNYYFSYGGKLENDDARRGLNCITYVGAVYGVPASTGALSGYGTQLADYLGASKCDMEGKKEADIKKFFAEHTTGNYIMWKSTHVVLVSDGTVYEFSEGVGGFRSMSVDQWPFGKSTFWIRKVDKAFGSMEPGFTQVRATSPTATPPNNAASPPLRPVLK